MRAEPCRLQFGTRTGQTRMRHLTPSSWSQCVSHCSRATCCISRPCGELCNSWRRSREAAVLIYDDDISTGITKFHSPAPRRVSVWL